VIPAQRIDVHAHMAPGFYREALAASGRVPTSGARIEWSPELALGTMDAHGIAAALLSISFPGVHFGDDRAARALARRCNELAAELAGRWPGRFGGFAVLPLPDIDGALAELAFAMDELALDGVILLASYEGRFLGDEAFDPLLAELDRRGTAVLVHPGMHASSRELGMPWPGFMLEFLVDTSRAAINLLFSGALERFRDVKFILAHGGGVIPYISWRLSVAPIISPLVPQWPQERIFAGLRRFWYDTALCATRRALPVLMETAAPERIVFGSDWPYAPAEITGLSIEGLRDSPGVTDRRLAGIERENALKLFPRLANQKTEEKSR
jgi:predicted TIM-barrel fold metal-dependent hydrolase